MKILNVLSVVYDLLMEGLNINQDVFDDDRKNIKYEENGNNSSYRFTKQIFGKTLEVHLDIYDQKFCHVGFTINGSHVKERKAKYDIRLALQVLSYVVSCMRSIQNIHHTIEIFEFAADAEHEAQYDKLLPRLSSKLDFEYEKYPWDQALSTRERFKKVVEVTAIYEIHLQ